jgi:insertion element IS1 protein InsB
VDRGTRHTIAWVIGGRDIATVKRLYAKLKHLKKVVFYTDDWDAFAAVLPKKQHVIGKEHTVTIERNNSNTRHRLARMTRKTKVVSHAEIMIDLSMRLFAFFEPKEHRTPWIKQFLSIF